MKNTNKNHRKRRYICAFTAVLLLFTFCLSGCGTEDSVSIDEDIKSALQRKPDNKVYKVFYGYCKPFFAHMPIGETDLDMLQNEWYEFHDAPYVLKGYYYYIAGDTGAWNMRNFGNGDPYALAGRFANMRQYVDNPQLVFDSSVSIKEIYILQDAESSSNDFICYFTDIGDYVLIIRSSIKNGEIQYDTPCLLTIDEYSKLLYDAYSARTEHVYGSIYVDIEDYELTEPLKKNIGHYTTEIIIGSAAVVLLIAVIIVDKRRRKNAVAPLPETVIPESPEDTPNVQDPNA